MPRFNMCYRPEIYLDFIVDADSEEEAEGKVQKIWGSLGVSVDEPNVEVTCDDLGPEITD